MPQDKKSKKLVMDYAEKHDLPTVSVHEAKTQLKLSIEQKQFRGTIVLVGDSGVGKTEIVEQVAAEYEMPLKIIRTAQFGLLASGVPMTRNLEDGFFKIALPTIFPQPGEKAIVLFDELNQGLQHSIATFFSLLETGEMYGYHLPEGCIVVGTMNPSTAQYAVTQIESNAALRRRLKFFFVSHSSSGWLQYAKTKHFHRRDKNIPALQGEAKACHPDIHDYFRIHPSKINDDNAREQSKQYICPATIQTISLDAYILESYDIPLHSQTAINRFSASIGFTNAIHIAKFLEDRDAFIDPEKILRGSRTELNKVKKANTGNRTDLLGEVAQSFVSSLFNLRIDPAQAADNFLALYKELPSDVQGSMFSLLSPTAKKEKGVEYLKKLHQKLATIPEWLDLNIQAYDDFEELENQIQKSSN